MNNQVSISVPGDTENQLGRIIVNTDTDEGVQVWLSDGISDSIVRLASFKDGTWKYKNPYHFSKFLKIAKESPKLRRVIEESIVVVKPGDFDSWFLRWNCFQRRVQIKVTKLRKSLKQVSLSNYITISN